MTDREDYIRGALLLDGVPQDELERLRSALQEARRSDNDADLAQALADWNAFFRKHPQAGNVMREANHIHDPQACAMDRTPTPDGSPAAATRRRTSADGP